MVGAIAAALIILATGRYWVDPLASMMIGVVILYSSWHLVKESVHILMEAVPSRVGIRDIEEAMLRQPGICCVHDLHVWSISSNRVALSAHVVLSDPEQNRTLVLNELNEILHEKFKIDHTTIQIEGTHEIHPEVEGLVCRPGTECNVPEGN